MNKIFKVTLSSALCLMAMSATAGGLDVIEVGSQACGYTTAFSSLPVKVKNNTGQEIYTVSYQYTIGTKKGGRFDYTLKYSVPAEAGKEAVINLPIDAVDEVGTFPSSVTVTQYNSIDNDTQQKTTNFNLPVYELDQVPAGAKAYTICNEKTGSIGVGYEADWFLGIQLKNPLLVGCKVIGITAYGLPEEDTNQTGAWLSAYKWMQGDEPSIANVDAVKEGTTLTAVFDEPYELTSRGVYVGYKMHSSVAYPAPFGPIKQTGMLLANWGAGFKDYGAEYGCLPITIWLEGDMPGNALELTGLDGSLAIGKGKTFSLTFNVTNKGAENVKEVGYKYTFDSKTTTGVAQTNVPAEFNGQGTFQVEFPAVSTKGSYPLTLELTTVDGQANRVTSNPVSATLTAYSFAPRNCPLLEEATASWCGFCTRGFIALKTLAQLYPDFVGAAWHNTDPMAITGTYPFNFGNGYPGASLNRTLNAIDPYQGYDGDGVFGMKTLYAQEAAKFGTADIDVVTNWGANKETLDVEVSVTAAAPLSNCKLGYMLLANGLSHPNQNGWMQNNTYAYFNNSGPLAEVCSLPETIRDMVYDDVVIYGTDAAGVANSLPASVAEEATVTSKYTFPTKSLKGIQSYEHEVDGQMVNEPWELIQDYNKLDVVVILLDADGHVLNSRKVHAGEAATGIDNLVVGESENGAEILYYDLMGRRVANPGHGIFVKVQGNKACKIAL